MKRFLCLVLIFACAVTFAFGGGGRQSAASVSGGSPGGKIVIYTSMYENVIESLKQVTQRQFPNCEIEFVYGGTGQIQTKIAAEMRSGKLGCDMLLVADPSYSIELKEKGLLHKFISQTAQGGELAFDYDREGYWYPVRISNMVLAYNPELNPKDSVPNSFYDFAHDPLLAGVVAMSNPLSSGTAMAAVTALRDKYGYEYFDALGRQNVKVESGAVSLEKLESGEYKAVMILEESVLQKKQEENSALEVIYPSDGTIMIPSTIMTIAGEWSANGNTGTAEIITEWFLSPDGQNAIVDGWMHSARKGFPKLPHGALHTSEILANNMPVNWESCLRERGEIQAKFEEYITGREPAPLE